MVRCLRGLGSRANGLGPWVGRLLIVAFDVQVPWRGFKSNNTVTLMNILRSQDGLSISFSSSFILHHKGNLARNSLLYITQ